MTHSQAIAAVGPTEQAKILVVEDDPDIRKISSTSARRASA